MKKFLRWKLVTVLVTLVSLNSYAMDKPVDATHEYEDTITLSLIASMGFYGNCKVKPSNNVDWKVSSDVGEHYSFGRLSSGSLVVLETLNRLGMCSKGPVSVDYLKLDELDDSILIGISQAGGTGKCVAGYHDNGKFSMRIGNATVNPQALEKSWAATASALRISLAQHACDNDKFNVINN